MEDPVLKQYNIQHPTPEQWEQMKQEAKERFKDYKGSEKYKDYKVKPLGPGRDSINIFHLPHNGLYHQFIYKMNLRRDMLFMHDSVFSENDNRGAFVPLKDEPELNYEEWLESEELRNKFYQKNRSAEGRADDYLKGTY